MNLQYLLLYWWFKDVFYHIQREIERFTEVLAEPEVHFVSERYAEHSIVHKVGVNLSSSRGVPFTDQTVSLLLHNTPDLAHSCSKYLIWCKHKVKYWWMVHVWVHKVGSFFYIKFFPNRMFLTLQYKWFASAYIGIFAYCDVISWNIHAYTYICQQCFNLS